MVSGIFVDQTSDVDFICWAEAVLKFKNILRPSLTHKINNYKVKTVNSSYTKRSHSCQILLEKTSTLEVIECEPHVHPIVIIAIAGLRNKDDREQITVCKVNHIPQKES